MNKIFKIGLYIFAILVVLSSWGLCFILNAKIDTLVARGGVVVGSATPTSLPPSQGGTGISTFPDLGNKTLETTGTLKVKDGAHYSTFSQSGTEGVLSGDTKGDVSLFDGANSGENYKLRFYGYNTAISGPTYAQVSMDDLYDEFLINAHDTSSSTTLNVAVQLDNDTTSVFRIKNSSGSEVASIDALGNLHVHGTITSDSSCSCSGGIQ